MTGHYAFTSLSDPPSYIPSGQSNLPSQIVNSPSSSSHNYSSSLSFSTSTHAPSYSNSNDMFNMNSPGLPHAFPVPVPIQEPYFNGGNGQLHHGYPSQPHSSTKWQSNGAWTSPIITQGIGDSWSNLSGMSNVNQPRPRLTTTLWEDENTVCFQVDAKGICVARRQDNDMVNGTKLLNVTGMSRGKRDGILKNEKGRVVVKVGAMHLKGVWITISRAKALATQFKISDLLFPLLVDDPSPYLYSPHYPASVPSRIGLPAEANPYITSFADPTVSVRSQSQQHLMISPSRMGYGSSLVSIHDPHVGMLPHSSQPHHFSIPYRHPGGNPHIQPLSMTPCNQGMEPYLISEAPRISSRFPPLHGGIGQEEPVSRDASAQSLINPAPHHLPSTEYSADECSRLQPYSFQSVHKTTDHQTVPSSSTIVSKKRNHTVNVDNETTIDEQILPEQLHSHNGTAFGPLNGRGYSSPSPCSLPSPSMSQIQQDMPPVNKRTKVLRYDSNLHTGYIDPHNQLTRSSATNRIPASIGQESIGSLFGTLSPPESESEGSYVDNIHTKSVTIREYEESIPVP